MSHHDRGHILSYQCSILSRASVLLRAPATNDDDDDDESS